MAAVLLTLASFLTCAGGRSSCGGPGATITTPTLVLTVSPEGNVTGIVDRVARLNRALD
eukprot:COSAG04_NODE_22078_length_361_cov_1.370229_1_plen_58_part_01